MHDAYTASPLKRRSEDIHVIVRRYVIASILCYYAIVFSIRLTHQLLAIAYSR